MNKTFLFSLYEEAVRVSKPKHCLPDYFSTFSKGERVCKGRQEKKMFAHFFDGPKTKRGKKGGK